LRQRRRVKSGWCFGWTLLRNTGKADSHYTRYQDGYGKPFMRH
jgi:hypothetical protein